MSKYLCGHFRHPVHRAFNKANDDLLRYMAGHAYTPQWRNMARQELEQRMQSCPGCTNSARREWRHWAAFAAAVLVFIALAAVSCESRAAQVPCAPYTPVDGRTCEPPTRARVAWGGEIVCLCPTERIARK